MVNPAILRLAKVFNGCLIGRTLLRTQAKYPSLQAVAHADSISSFRQA